MLDSGLGSVDDYGTPVLGARCGRRGSKIGSSLDCFLVLVYVLEYRRLARVGELPEDGPY